MTVPTRRILDPIFGEPTLISRNNGDAVWSRSGISPYFQKGSSGWLANLYGGVQTSWISFASIYIPANEIFVPDFNSALWTYYFTEAESFGVNMVIWAHDPADNDKRAEITQQADISTLEKAIGWNAHELDTSVSQFYFYGEGVSGNTTCTTEATNYTWAQYQADPMF